MKEKDVDLVIAKIVKNSDFRKNQELEQEKVKKKQIKAISEITKITKYKFEEKLFLNGLFSMVLPQGLFHYSIEEGNINLFKSSQEQVVLVIKAIKTEKNILPEEMKSDYLKQMKLSRQQSQIMFSNIALSHLGKIYYFTAIHNMPEGKKCDFIIIFQLDDKMIMMDFNYNEDEYSFWTIN